jgi:hypothetical protein
VAESVTDFFFKMKRKERKVKHVVNN